MLSKITGYFLDLAGGASWDWKSGDVALTPKVEAGDEHHCHDGALH